jgi:hypothetical protein
VDLHDVEADLLGQGLPDEVADLAQGGEVGRSLRPCLPELRLGILEP